MAKPEFKGGKHLAPKPPPHLTQDPKQPNSQLGFLIRISNPEFTPQPNDWGFSLLDGFGKFLDIKEKLVGYDITGRLRATIKPGFSYQGQRNTIKIVFVPTTILNQADPENILLVQAPQGYVFGEQC